MKYKKYYLVLICFFSVFFLFAQNKKQSSNNKDSKKDFNKNFVMGEQIVNKNESYFLLLNVLAKSSEHQTQSLQANEKLLTSKGNFKFYQTSKSKVQHQMQSQSQATTNAANQPQVQTNTNPGGAEFIVAWNKRTKQLAVVTGSILIKMKDFSQSDGLVRDYNLLETHRFGGFNKLVIAKVDLMKINLVIAEIRSDIRVENVQAEILENFDYPQ